MIERFNFYDIYGYLLPGLALIVVISLPLVPFTSRSGVEWSSLAVALPVAYIVGHYMATISKFLFPTTQLDAGGTPRHFSVLVLNPTDTTFSKNLKDEIGKRVKAWFNLDVKANVVADDEIAKVRDDAFFVCRKVVNETSGYGEQHQGLYNLMRGLALAFWLGTFYTGGWVLSPFLGYPVVWVIAIPLSIAALIWMVLLSTGLAKDIPMNQKSVDSFVSLCALLFAIGLFLGSTRIDMRGAFIFVPAVMLYITAGQRFSTSAKYFADEFAKAIWRHFAAEPFERPVKG